MTASGFTEVVTMSFISGEAAREFLVEGEAAGQLALLNPLTEDIAVMRTSLIPGLLSVMKRNVSFRWENLKLYEVGRTFRPVPGQELPREELKLAGLASGGQGRKKSSESGKGATQIGMIERDGQ